MYNFFYLRSYSDFFLIKKARFFKNLNMSTGEKIIHNSSNSSQVRTLSLLVPKIRSELSSWTHSVTVISVGSLSF